MVPFYTSIANHYLLATILGPAGTIVRLRIIEIGAMTYGVFKVSHAETYVFCCKAISAISSFMQMKESSEYY